MGATGFAIEMVLDTAAFPRTPLSHLPLMDCRGTAATHGKRQGVSVTFSKAATAGHALELNLVDGAGRNQTYTSDPEARLWLQAEHHVTFIVDGFARTITSVADGVFVRRPHPRSLLSESRSSLRFP